MKYLIIVGFLSLAVAGLSSCKSSQGVGQEFTPMYTPGPRTYVYKTNEKYDKLVPVILSEDKGEIISYPAPSDIAKMENPRPTRLKKGYLLDNRGINKDVAFLSMDYSEYAAMKETPNAEALYKMIIDKDPLTELCDCGNRTNFNDVEGQLNALISEGLLRKKCKTLK